MRILVLLICLIMTLGCTSHTDKPGEIFVHQKPPPPPLSPEDQKICDSLKRIAYSEIDNGRITLICRDTISDYFMHKVFVDFIERKFHIKYFGLYNENSPETVSKKVCVMAIFDSFIVTRFGVNGKDSLINEAYRLTDSVRKRRKL